MATVGNPLRYSRYWSGAHWNLCHMDNCCLWWKQRYFQKRGAEQTLWQVRPQGYSVPVHQRPGKCQRRHSGQRHQQHLPGTWHHFFVRKCPSFLMQFFQFCSEVRLLSCLIVVVRTISNGSHVRKRCTLKGNACTFAWLQAAGNSLADNGWARFKISRFELNKHLEIN